MNKLESTWVLPPGYSFTWQLTACTDISTQLKGCHFPTLQASLQVPDLWYEVKLLKRLMYKNHSQHRSSHFLYLIQSVTRRASLLDSLALPTLISNLQSMTQIATELKSSTSGSTSKGGANKIPGVASFGSALGSGVRLSHKVPCQEACGLVMARLLGACHLSSGLISTCLEAGAQLAAQVARTFFMPLCTTAMAMVARVQTSAMQLLSSCVAAYNSIADLMPLLPTHSSSGSALLQQHKELLTTLPRSVMLTWQDKQPGITHVPASSAESGSVSRMASKRLSWAEVEGRKLWEDLGLMQGLYAAYVGPGQPPGPSQVSCEVQGPMAAHVAVSVWKTQDGSVSRENSAPGDLAASKEAMDQGVSSMIPAQPDVLDTAAKAPQQQQKQNQPTQGEVLGMGGDKRGDVKGASGGDTSGVQPAQPVSGYQVQSGSSPATQAPQLNMNKKKQVLEVQSKSAVPVAGAKRSSFFDIMAAQTKPSTGGVSAFIDRGTDAGKKRKRKQDTSQVATGMPTTNDAAPASTPDAANGIVHDNANTAGPSESAPPVYTTTFGLDGGDDDDDTAAVPDIVPVYTTGAAFNLGLDDDENDDDDHHGDATKPSNSNLAHSSKADGAADAQQNEQGTVAAPAQTGIGKTTQPSDFPSIQDAASSVQPVSSIQNLARGADDNAADFHQQEVDERSNQEQVGSQAIPAQQSAPVGAAGRIIQPIKQQPAKPAPAFVSVGSKTTKPNTAVAKTPTAVSMDKPGVASSKSGAGQGKAVGNSASGPSPAAQGVVGVKRSWEDLLDDDAGVLPDPATSQAGKLMSKSAKKRTKTNSGKTGSQGLVNSGDQSQQQAQKKKSDDLFNMLLGN